MKIDYNLWLVGVILIMTFQGVRLQAQEEDLLASAEEVNIIVLEPSFTPATANSLFEKKYHFWVARAYFKLLAEAQKSERELKLQAERYTFENEKFNREGNLTFQRKLSLAHKKYKAHSAMLSGLKSWNLFSDNRTGDMFYFMEENEDRMFQMFKKNHKEDKMVKYLIYRLADLYHFEE